MSTVYVLRVQFMCPNSTVYVLRVQFMSFKEYSLCPYFNNSLCPKSTVYVPMVQFMSSECSLCPQSTVYVPRVQFMFLREQLSSEYMSSLCPKCTVLFPRVHVLLCLIIVYVLNSLCPQRKCLCPQFR